MNSIRRRLLIWQIGALILTALLASLLTYSLAWDGFNRLRDYGLEQIAYSIVRHGVESDSGDDEETDPADRGQFVSQIWMADGSLAYSSLENGGPPPQKPGKHRVYWEGEEWHTYTLHDGGLTIQVGNPIANRARIFAGIALWLMLPITALVVMLGGFIWMSVGRALSPLEHVRAEVGQRDAGKLSLLDTKTLPDEVAPLVETLNELLLRLDSALASQRRFVADAAHELRTPLTAVRLQAQLASRAQLPGERDAALAQLLAGVDRASHLVEQLLQMARLEPDAHPAAFSEVRLDALAKRIVAEFSTQAEAKGIDLGVGACQPAAVSGNAESLRVMLSNLVDNALRYTPAGGRVDVEIGATSGEAILSVTDSGPGIPAAERERVFDRFHRLAGADTPGSGLGLAIVRRVVLLHGGTVTLADAPGGGLSVRVALPSLTAP
jgi:two-component system, OmpR family, sensor kinase